MSQFCRTRTPNRWTQFARFVVCATAIASLSLTGCALDDYSLPIPDEDITEAERIDGDKAVEAIRVGGADPAIDNALPGEDADGEIEVPVPAGDQEPSAEVQAADAQMLAQSDDTDGDQIVQDPPTADIEGSEDPVAAPSSTSSEPGTGTSVEAHTVRRAPARPSGLCRRAQGYIRGRAYRLCVVQVGGKLVGVQTAVAFARMRAAARRSGVSLGIVSGFRTMRQQRFLYALFLRGRGNLAARPGYSNHQSGIALDLNTARPGVYRWLARNAHRFGFRRTVPSEPWHWEYRG